MGIRTHMWHWIGVSSLVLALVLVLDRQMVGSVDVPTSSSVSAQDFLEGTSFYTLYHEGTPVGQIRTTRARRLPSGFVYDVRTELRLTAMGQSVEILVELSANFDATFGLENIDFSMASGPTSAKGRAEVQGQVLNIELTTGDTTIKHDMPFDRHLVLSALLGPRITADALKPGDTRALNVFDPLSQTVRKTQITAVAYEDIRVLDRPVKTLKVRQETMGVVLNGWVNARGEMVRQELGLGLVAQLEPKAVAQHHSAQKKGRVDLISEVMIPVKSMPKSLHKYSMVQYRISGLSSAAVLENTARQSWADSVMTLTREMPIAQTPFTASKPRVDGDDLLYQAGNDRVRALALEIAGEASTMDQLVANALSWFDSNIKQEAVASIPSALETLRTRTGDCNEHAFLFAGIMRSLGVETRVVAGIAYVKRLEKFGYHAWNEIKIGDRFVTVDPTWQQFPADLTHIALARGGLQAQAHLWSLMGRLKVDVLESNP